MGKVHIFIHDGNYVTVSGDYTCDLDIVANLGESWQDFLDGKYVLLNEEHINFLNENPSATPEEVWNLSISEIANAGDISSLLSRIADYSESEEVKTFYVNNTPIWFDSEKRTSINTSISFEKEVGKETTILWISGTPYEMSIEDARQFLIDIDSYSKSCYDNTQRNLSEAKTLTLKEEVNSFDIAKGYPEKLKFNL